MGNAINSNDHYHSDFLQIVGLSGTFVYSDITRNVTISDARAFYLLNKEKITQYKVESVNLGDEGYGYVTSDSSIVVFRKGNIIVTTQYALGVFGTIVSHHYQ